MKRNSPSWKLMEVIVKETENLVTCGWTVPERAAMDGLVFRIFMFSFFRKQTHQMKYWLRSRVKYRRQANIHHKKAKLARK